MSLHTVPPVAAMPPTLLIIDDNPISRKLFRAAVVDEGYEILEAPDGETGLALAATWHPAVVLQDLDLPDIDGFELAGRLRKLPGGDRLRIVACTAFLSATPPAGGTLGFDDFVVRPVEPVRLRDLVRKHMGRGDESGGRHAPALSGSAEERSGLQAVTLGVLAGLANALAGRGDLEEILGEALGRCLDAVGIPMGALYIRRPDGRLEAAWQCGYGPDLAGQTGAGFGHLGSLAEVAEQGLPTSVPGPAMPADAAGELLARAGATSALLVPLVAGGETSGLVLMMSEWKDLGEANWLDFARTLSVQLGQAIRLTRKQREADALAAVARMLTESLDAGTVGARIIESVSALFRVRSAGFRLLRPDGALVAVTGDAEAHAPAGHVLAPGTGFASYVLAESRPVFSADVLSDERFVLDDGIRERIVSLELAAFLAVPLRVKGKSIGVLSIADRPGRKFTADDAQLLETFADQAALALQNARHYEIAERRRRAAETLTALSHELSRSLDPAVVARRIVDSLPPLLGAQSAGLYRLDPPSGSFERLAVHGETSAVLSSDVVFPRGTGVMSLALAARGPVATPDLLEDPRVTLTPELRRRIERANYRAVLAIPLVTQDRIVGVLALGDRAGREFDPDDVRLAEAFADQAALALENARHYEAAERRRGTAEALAEMGRLLSQSLDVGVVGRRIVDSVGSLMGTRYAVLYRLDPASGDLHALAVAGDLGPILGNELVLPAGTGVAGRAVAERAPVTTLDFRDDPAIVLPPLARGGAEGIPYGAVLAVPLVVQDRVIGALAVADPAGRVFDGDEIRLAQTLADHVALALQNAEHYETAERRRRGAEELAQVARTLSETLDPREVAGRIVESVLPLFGAVSATVRHLVSDGSLELVAITGPARAVFGIGHRLPSGVGIPGRAVTENRAVWARDAAEESGLSMSEDQRRRLARAGLGGRLSVPMRARRTLVGVLSIECPEPRDFGMDEVALLQAFADHAALALENARLHDDTVRRGDELGALLTAVRTVMAGDDLNRTLDRIVEEAARIARTPFVKVLLWDEGTGDFRPGAVLGVTPPAGSAVARSHTYSAKVAETGEPLFVADIQADPANPLVDQDRADGIRTYLGLPIRYGGQMLGVLSFHTADPHEYAREDVEYLASFADQAALAIRSAQLLEAARSRESRLATLLEVSRELSRIQPQEELLQRIAEACGRLIGSDSVGFRLLEADELVVRGTVGDAEFAMAPKPRIKLEEQSLSGLVVASGEPLVVNDVGTDTRVSSFYRDILARLGHRAWLGVPVKLGDRVLGVLSIRTARPDGFSRDDVALAQAFASQAATALDNARLYHEAQDAYQKLAQTQDQLVQAQKMEAIGRLAGGVAHDFNNLLTVILGRAHGLLKRLPAGDPLRRHATLIQQTGERAAALTRQLLAFSRRQVLEPRVLDVNAIVTGMEKLLRRLIGEDVELVIVPGAGLGRVKADPSQVEQVMMNLVVNARDAMADGGRLVVTTANLDLDAAAVRRHPDAVPGRYVVLEVTDTGSGMDEATRARIFEPFFTTKGPGKGTGLGLATVFGVVRQSEGHIWVYSEPGHGTTFKILLPRVDAPQEALGTADAQSGARGTETVLLVEDDAALRELTAEMLAEMGYTVLDAANGEDAVQRAAEHTGRIDLLLTDVIMPRMNGRDLAARVVTARPGVRVLYMSGYTDEVVNHHGVLDPRTVLLQKPFAALALGRKIREVLDRESASAPAGKGSLPA